jgi:lipocalin-like protein
MRLSNILLCAVVLASAAPLGATQPTIAQRLVGSWELVSYEIVAADGSRRPGAYDRGQITYDASGRMSAHLMHSSNKADQSPQTDDVRAAAYRRYLGYWGPFVVDAAAGHVTHIVEGSSNPSWVGSRQVRYYELSADDAQLILSLRDGTRTTQSLVWKRLR